MPKTRQNKALLSRYSPERSFFAFFGLWTRVIKHFSRIVTIITSQHRKNNTIIIQKYLFYLINSYFIWIKIFVFSFFFSIFLKLLRHYTTKPPKHHQNYLTLFLHRPGQKLRTFLASSRAPSCGRGQVSIYGYLDFFGAMH